MPEIAANGTVDSNARSIRRDCGESPEPTGRSNRPDPYRLAPALQRRQCRWRVRAPELLDDTRIGVPWWNIQSFT